MQAQLTTRPVEQVVAAIQALDLDPIKLKLMNPEEGHGWSRKYADQMELAYKRFLTLLMTHPEETIAPSKDVDKFWHGHILDTIKYAEDCQNVFGYFLHHFPYFGMRGAEDAANLKAAAENMKRLYQHEFGSAPNGGAGWCTVAANARDIAWCTVAVRAKDTGWCTVAVKAQDTAWCTVAIDAKKAAWCTVARPMSGELNLWVRPALPDKI
jgi:hypothetical protein